MTATKIIMVPLVLHYLVPTATCVNVFPLRLPPVNYSPACPTRPSPESWSLQQQLQVNRLLTEKYGEACLSKQRVVRLNMSEASSQCPGTWNLIESPVRGCRSGLRSRACASASFSTVGRTTMYVVESWVTSKERMMFFSPCPIQILV